MKHLFFIAAVCLSLSSVARAGESVGTEREIVSGLPVKLEEDKRHWSDGIHIIAGLGVNGGIYDNDNSRLSLGVGSNLRSDVGYYFGNGWGVEFSGSVMFNTIRGGLLWTTTLATGVRFGLPILKRAENFAPYGRVLVGRATSVSYLSNGVPEQYAAYNPSRLQAEGGMFGLGVGFFQRSSANRIWYMEITAERHDFSKIQAIRDVNEVPTVVDTELVNDSSELYAVCLTFGLMIF